MRSHSSRQGHHSHRRHGRNGQRRIRRGISSPYSRRLRIEPLEDRSLLSAVSWDGGGDGLSWTDSLNWSGNSQPGINDDVTIDAPGSLTVKLTSPGVTVHTLAIAANDTLSLDQFGSLNVTAASTIAGTISSLGSVTFGAATSVGTMSLVGALSGAGDLTITNSLTCGSALMTGAGRMIIAPDATLTIVASLQLSRTLQNDGTGTWVAGSLLFSGATFQNNGTLTVSYNGMYPLMPGVGASGGTNVFNNAGTFIKQGDTAFGVQASSGTFKFNNSGSIDVQGSTLDLLVGGTNTGSIAVADSAAMRFLSSTYTVAAGASFSGPGSLTIAGGTLNVNSPVTAQNLALSSGVLSGSAEVTVTRSLAWTGGSMTGSGRTVISPTGSLSISTTSIHDLGRTLENDGSAIWSGGDLRMSSAMFQNNGAMTTFSPAAGLICYATSDILATSSVFINAGTFTALGGGETQFQNGVSFNSNGAVDGKVGIIKLYAGGDYGPLAAFAGAVTLGKNSTTSTHIFESAVNVTGTLSFATPIAFDSPVVFSGPGNIVLGNTLNGAADVTFNTTFNWLTGAMSGAGKTIIAPGGSLNFNGSGFMDLNRTLQNNGAAVWSSGSIRMNNGTFQNNGSFQVVLAPGLSGPPTLWANGGVNAFNNSGSFTTVFPSSSTSVTIGVPFNNSGVLNGLSGGVLLNAGGVASGPAIVFAGAVTMGSGSFAIGGAASVLGSLTISAPLPLTLNTATTFSGSGSVTLAAGMTGNPNATFATTLNWTGGGMTGTGKTTITADGALNLSGSTHTLGRTLQNDGATLWTGGDLTMTGGAFLNNGTFQANSTSTLSSVGSGGSGSFSNAGLFLNQRGTTRFATLSGSSVPFNNSGNVTVAAGVLELNAGGTSTGSFVMEAGASLSFTGSASLYSSGVGATFDGAGIVTVNGATLSVDAATSIPNLTLSSGTIAGAADVTVSRMMTWTLGSMSGAGATIIAPTATLTIYTNSGVQLSRELRNNGQAVWLGGNLQMIGGTVQNNGTFEVAPIISTGVQSTNGGGVNAFNNAGSFITSSAGPAQFAVPFNNLGTVSGPAIPIASLVLAGGGAHGLLATFGSTVAITGGIHTFGATTNIVGTLQVLAPISFATASTFSGIGNVRLSSDLSGAAGVTFNTTVIWTGGTMSGAGKTIIGPSGALIIGFNSHTLSRTLQNDGTVTWTAGSVVLTNGDFQNNGSFQTLSFDQPLTMSAFGGVNSFSNAGQFTHMANGATPQNNLVTISIPFNNYGTVDGRFGTINLTGGGAHGPQAVFAGTVNLSGAHTFGATTTVSGTLTLSNLVNFDSPVLFTGAGSVTLTSDISGSADVTFENALIWKSGTMHGGGKTIIAPSGSLNISIFGATPILLDRTLVNNGVTTWTAGVLNMGGGGGAAIFQNNGSFVAVGLTLQATGFGAFNNVGRFTELSGSSVEFAMTNGFRVLFNNSGTLDGKFGQILLGAGGTHAASATFAGNIKLSGGTNVFGSTVTVTGALLITTPLTIDSPVVFSGPGSVELSASLDGAADVTFHTSLIWSSGTMTGTGKTIVAPDGSLLLSTPSGAPNAPHNLNRVLQNDGAAIWTTGDLNMNGGTFQNNGVFTTRKNTLSSQLNFNGVTGLNAFNNIGQLVNVGRATIWFQSTGTGVKFNNSGVADASSGFMLIGAGGDNADGATFGGNVSIMGSPVSFGATTNLTGVLTIGVPWNITDVHAFNGPGRLSLRSATTLTSGGALTGGALINLGNTITSDAPITWTQPVEITGTGTINSPATLNTLLVSGILTGTGDISILNQLTWTGGQLNGTGALTVASGASLLINGSAHSLHRPLRTDGNTTWDGVGVTSSAVWQNYGEITVNLHYVSDGLSTSPGQFGGNSATFTNFGTFISIGPSTLGVLGLFDNEGVLDIRNGITQMSGTYSGSGVIVGAPAGTLLMVTDLISTTTNPAQFSGLGNVQFQTGVFSGPVVPLLFEAQSQDLGDTAAGFLNNSAIQSLSLGPWPFGATYVRLVDQSNNASGDAPEAVYVDTLVVPAGRTLDLNGLHLYVRDAQIAGIIKGGQVTKLVPQVSQVLVSSTSWAPAFSNQLQTAILGDGGYAIPGNALDQLAPLSWSNLDQIKIVFNEDVNVQAESLTISSANLDVISITPLSFTYDNSSHTATWTLAQPIGNDTISMSLASTGPAAVTDSHGAALDGEWPSATGNFPSGDGATGGDFHFSFNVLPGDVTQDGIVDIQDITNVANHWLQASPLSDGNGDGVVNIQETTLIANHWLQSNGNAAVSGAIASAQGGGGANADGDLASLVAATSAIDSMSDSDPGIPANDLAGGPAPSVAPAAPPAPAARVASVPSLPTAAGERIAAVVEGPSPIVPQPIASQAPWLAAEFGSSVDINGADDQTTEVSTVAKRVAGEHPSVWLAAAVDQALATMDEHSVLHRHDDVLPCLSAALTTAPKPLGKSPLRAIARQS